MKKLNLKFTRIIPTTPAKAYSAWLNPKTPGNPWYEGKKIILNAKANGLFYWYISGTPHYGRFTKVQKGRLVQHTWMSPYTLGEESTVTVSFKKKGADTLMTLTHTGLPNNPKGRGHEDGWNYFLDKFMKARGK